MEIDWAMLNEPLLSDDAEVSWDLPGPPPRIWGKWLIFAEEWEGTDAALAAAMGLPTAE
jgi:hypothetical protein